MGAHKGGGGDPKSRQLRQFRGVGSHKGGRSKAGFDVWVLTKGGLVCITHTPLLLNRFEVAVLTKGGEAIPNPDPDSLLLNRFEVSVLTKGGFEVWVLTKGGLVCIIKQIRGCGSHKGGEAIPNPDNFPDYNIYTSLIADEHAFSNKCSFR